MKQSITTFFVFLFSFTAFANNPNYAVDNIPDSLLENVHTVIRFEHQQYIVQSIGKATEKIKAAITIVNNKSTYDDFRVYYDQFTKVGKIKARIYDVNGKKVRDISKSEVNEMEWEGSMNVRCRDYAAYSMREDYVAEDNEAAYIASIESDNEGLNIDDFKIEGIEEIGKGVKESYVVNFSNQVMDGGDLLYFNPMLTFGSDENPFKLKERTYPVDYPYPQSKVYSLQYTIPTGYTVDELPEANQIALPNKSGQFSYSVKIQGDKIMVLSQFKIYKNLFLPEEYQALKEFYNIIIDKHSEQVVLKKT